MNCRRVFFAENEEGWDAGVNANKRKESANSSVNLSRRDISRTEVEVSNLRSQYHGEDNRDEDIEDLTVPPTGDEVKDGRFMRKIEKR